MTEIDKRASVAIRSMDRNASDLALVRNAFARNSPRVRSEQAFAWQYFDNTSTTLLVDIAIAEGNELAAIYATLPGHMRIGGSRRFAVQSLDTLTEPAHRGKGLFVKLANTTFERALGAGAALIYGFPNSSSAPGFFQKLGWSSLDPVPFLVRPVRARYFADRLKIPQSLQGWVPNRPLILHRRTFLGRELMRADSRITDLWNDFATSVGVGLERDEAFFEWRVFKKPDEDYRTVVIEREGSFDALCTYASKNKHGGRIGYVMELMHRRSVRGALAARHLLHHALEQMAHDGADAVLAWSMPHSRNFFAYLCEGFVPLPEAVRPIELHFGARVFDPSITEIVRDRRQWYLSYLDSDTV